MQVRVATRDAEIEGIPIRQDQTVVTMIGSVNRDPRHYQSPDVFNIVRPDSEHLGFGFGSHFCLGAQLARLEATVARAALVQRFPDMKLAGPANHGNPDSYLRGLSTLPLDWAAP